MSNQSLNIQIHADNQHVVSLLQDSETRLMQMLDGNGLKVLILPLRLVLVFPVLVNDKSVTTTG